MTVAIPAAARMDPRRQCALLDFMVGFSFV
jgi:hypothetical protein